MGDETAASHCAQPEEHPILSHRCNAVAASRAARDMSRSAGQSVACAQDEQGVLFCRATESLDRLGSSYPYSRRECQANLNASCPGLVTPPRASHPRQESGRPCRVLTISRGAVCRASSLATDSFEAPKPAPDELPLTWVPPGTLASVRGFVNSTVRVRTMPLRCVAATILPSRPYLTYQSAQANKPFSLLSSSFLSRESSSSLLEQQLLRLAGSRCSRATSSLSLLPISDSTATAPASRLTCTSVSHQPPVAARLHLLSPLSNQRTHPPLSTLSPAVSLYHSLCPTTARRLNQQRHSPQSS